MSDWNLPTTASLYTDLVNGLKDRDLDLATMFATLPTNPVTNMVRWVSASNRFEIYNGASWVELSTAYAINVTSLNGQAAAFYQNAGNLTAGILLAARFNDTSHGSRGGGTTHSDVVAAGASGFMTGGDKTKLNAIENSATADQTGAEIKTAYEGEVNAFTDALFTKLGGIETGATIDQTGAEIKTAYEGEVNAFTDALFTKLSNIETAATADQTASEILALLLTVDGSGSLLDADLLDGSNLDATANVNTVVKRDGSADIVARRFRSEEATTNSSIGFMMTQVNTGADNFLRPSTPAQIRAGLNVEDGSTADQTKSDIDGLNIVAATIVSQGALATKNTVDTVDIDNGAITLPKFDIVASLDFHTLIDANPFGNNNHGLKIKNETVADNSYTKRLEIVCPADGTYTLKTSVVDLSGSYGIGGKVTYIQTYKNGAFIGTVLQNVENGPTVYLEEDFTFAKGDLIQAYMKKDAASTNGVGSLELGSTFGRVFNVIINLGSLTAQA